MAEPKLLYYNAAGKQVSEPVSGGRQFLSNDPLRPDAKAAPVEVPAVTEAEPVDAAVELVPAVEPEKPKAIAKPPADKARKSSANKAKK